MFFSSNIWNENSISFLLTLWGFVLRQNDEFYYLDEIGMAIFFWFIEYIHFSVLNKGLLGIIIIILGINRILTVYLNTWSNQIIIIFDWSYLTWFCHDSSWLFFNIHILSFHMLETFMVCSERIIINIILTNQKI